MERVPTREMTLYPEEAALLVPNKSGGYYDQLEAHILEPLYTIQSARDW